MRDEGYETAGQAGAGLARNLARGFPIVTKLNKAVIHMLILRSKLVTDLLSGLHRTAGVPTTLRITKKNLCFTIIL